MKLLQTFIGLTLSLAILLQLQTLFAQTAADTRTATIAVANDDVVKWEADVAGLPLIATNSQEIPRFGTFWLPPSPGSSGWLAPYPAMPDWVTGDEAGNLNVYALPDGGLLVDTPDGTNVWARINSVSNVIQRAESVAATAQSVSTASTMTAMDTPAPPMPGGTNTDNGTNGGGYAPAYNSYSFDTNALWLELTNVSDGIAYLNAHNATDEVYVVRVATNLLTPFNQWAIARDFWTTTDTTNVLPFTVNAAAYPNLFLRLEDWTGVTHGGNSVPDWYFWENFGTTDLADTNWDASGTNTLLFDYTNGLDPNPISFSLQASNLYVHTADVTVQLNLTNGLPSEYAWLVNATDFDAAVWQPFTTTHVPVTLGGGDGMYNVLVGLRKSPADSQPVWASVLLTLDTTPPGVTLTNPVGLLTQPLIQVQGYANEALSRLTYDVSNAAGVFTNQTAYLLGQAYDTNLAAFTTNYFQAYDVAVTNGDNLITLHAYDLADNETTVGYDYNVVFSTNPPVLSLVWPQPNALIGGCTFTLQAAVDDATAKVTATIVNTNGITHAVSAVVERNGNVWAANLPLSAGTNFVTLAATNAAGAVNATNFTIVQSGVSLTVDPIADDQLNQPAVTVTGTVSDPAQSVWVNGVAANVDAYGDWEADDVPVNDTGTADVQVQAGTDTNNLVSEQTFQQDQPTLVRVVSYAERQQTTIHVVQHCPEAVVGDSRDQEIDGWTLGAGGAMEIVSDYTQAGGGDINEHADNVTPWAADDPPLPPWPSAQISTADYWLAPGECSPTPVPESETISDVARTLVQLATTGAATDGNRLVRLLLTATDDNNNPLPPAAFTLQGQAFTPTADDANVGELYTVIPNGATPAFAPAGGYNPFHFTLAAQDVALQIYDANTTNNLSAQTNTVIVGQQMNLFVAVTDTNNNIITNAPLQNFQWSVPGYALTNFYVSSDSLWTNGYPIPLTATNRQLVNFFWADGDTNWSHPATCIVQCSATVNGKTIIGQAAFQVLKPIAKIITTTSSVQLGESIKSPHLFGMCFGTNGGQPGILFSNYIEMPPGTNYDYYPARDWWQTIDPPYVANLYFQLNTNIVPILTEITNTQIDTTWPYGFDHALPFPDTDDSPSTQLDSTGQTGAYVAQNSTMWLMFQPDGGNWVPLRKVSWFWSGSATNYGSGWILTSKSWSTNPPDADVENVYPTWTNNIYNFSN